MGSLSPSLCNVTKNCLHSHPELSILWWCAHDLDQFQRPEWHVETLVASLSVSVFCGPKRPKSIFHPRPLTSFLFWWCIFYFNSSLSYRILLVSVVFAVPHCARVYLTEYLTEFMKGHVTAAAAAKSLQSCPTLCDPRDGSPPGCPIPEILRSRTLEWVAISLMRESEVAQSCPTPSDPMDCSPPGSSVHGIFQAQVWQWSKLVNALQHRRTRRTLVD